MAYPRPIYLYSGPIYLNHDYARVNNELVLLRSAAPVRKTTALSGATFTISLDNHLSYFEDIDCNGVAAVTLTIVNPAVNGVYTLSFVNITALDITWPANVVDQTGTTFGTTSHSEDVMYTFQYDGVNFKAKSNS